MWRSSHFGSMTASTALYRLTSGKSKQAISNLDGPVSRSRDDIFLVKVDDIDCSPVSHQHPPKVDLRRWLHVPHCDGAILQTQILILFIYWRLIPHRVTSGLFTKSNLTQVEYNKKHAHFTNVKHHPKVSPFGIVLVK